jgi:hypothetical protein
MLSPKEEAINIVNEFLQVYDGRVIIAKKAALIAVNNILKAAFYADDKIYNYYLDVQQEIEKI